METPKQIGERIAYQNLSSMTHDEIAFQIAVSIIGERERCARIASSEMGDPDCDNRGMLDPETGDVLCDAEARGETCICGEIITASGRIAERIRNGR